jgi:hypothetical protein
MKTPFVGTFLTTYGRNVCRIFNPLGDSAFSKRNPPSIRTAAVVSALARAARTLKFFYKVYKFTQNHTISFQLYITAKPLHSNELESEDGLKRHTLPHPHVQKPVRQKLISNFPIRNHCRRLPGLINQKCWCPAHQTLDYRPLSKIIGFEFLLFESVHSPVAVYKDPSVLSLSPSFASRTSLAGHLIRGGLGKSLAAHRVTYGHIKSLNVNRFFCATFSSAATSLKNQKTCQNKKSHNFPNPT